jgi:ABC transport system ATP-binding/permease protein
MAQPSNLLILDEPTNDLDVETLDLLQDILGEYDGTVLLVSHDRDFIDRIATATVALEGEGRATVYPGGWSDYASQRPQPVAEAAKSAAKPAPVAVEKADPAPRGTGLSFTEKKRLDDLPAVIARLESEIAKLSAASGRPRPLFARAGEVPQGHRGAVRTPDRAGGRRERVAGIGRPRLRPGTGGTGPFPPGSSASPRRLR